MLCCKYAGNGFLTYCTLAFPWGRSPWRRDKGKARARSKCRSNVFKLFHLLAFPECRSFCHSQEMRSSLTSWASSGLLNTALRDEGKSSLDKYSITTGAKNHFGYCRKRLSYLPRAGLLWGCSIPRRDKGKYVANKDSLTLILPEANHQLLLYLAGNAFLTYCVLGFFGAARYGAATKGNILQNEWIGGKGWQGILNVFMCCENCCPFVMVFSTTVVNSYPGLENYRSGTCRNERASFATPTLVCNSNMLRCPLLPDPRDQICGDRTTGLLTRKNSSGR